MNSASPITFGWPARRAADRPRRSGRRTSRDGRSPARRTRAAPAGPSPGSRTRPRNHAKASVPRTLAISCGSQIPVVTPCGRTQRSNSCGGISEDSTWKCVSMKPGTTILPAQIDLPAAAIRSEGADDPLAADRDVGIHQVAGDEVEEPRALQNEVGLRVALPLRDRAPQEIHLCHRLTLRPVPSSARSMPWLRAARRRLRTMRRRAQKPTTFEPVESRDARLSFPHHHPRPQHGRRPRPLARHRHEGRAISASRSSRS